MGIDNKSLNLEGHQKMQVIERVSALGDLKISQLDQLVEMISEILYYSHLEHISCDNFLVVLDGDCDLYVLNSEDCQVELESFNLTDPSNILDHEVETFTILEFIEIFNPIYELKKRLIDQVIDSELTHFKSLF